MPHARLRAGNTSATRGISHVLRGAFALLPAGWKLLTVRADSGFFAEEFLEFLEERGLTYVVVARLTSCVRRQVLGLRHWVHIDENHTVSEFEAQLFGWKKPRRFVVVRELVRHTKEAVGRQRLVAPGYTFRIFATNRSEDALLLWCDYNQGIPGFSF